VFLRGLCWDVISNGQSQLLGSSAREAVKIGSALLEVVARERLAKTQQAGKGLAGAVVLWIVEIRGGAVIAYNSESYV
jgi:hypothetical protein